MILKTLDIEKQCLMIMNFKICKSCFMLSKIGNQSVMLKIGNQLVRDLHGFLDLYVEFDAHLEIINECMMLATLDFCFV